MRRPTIFPLFWSHAEGFNYDLYHRLEAEAEYFQMQTFHKWLKEQKYLKAVHIVTRTEFQELDSLNYADSQTSADTSESLQIIPLPKTRSVYICPRKIYCHRGSPSSCGRDCRRAQGGMPDQYVQETYFEVLKISKEVVFHKEGCEMD